MKLIALRAFAAALLVVAFVKFMLTVITSFQAEERVTQSHGGYQIDHIFEVNHWAVVLGLAGGVILVISFLGRRTPF